MQVYTINCLYDLEVVAVVSTEEAAKEYCAQVLNDPHNENFMYEIHRLITGEDICLMLKNTG